MLLVGLTGSIGMGKSTAAASIARMGVPVYDADAEVHKLLAPKGAAVPFVTQHFPQVVQQGVVDRKALGQIVFHNTAQREALEQHLYAHLRRRERAWLLQQYRAQHKIVVLDVPLLFEKNRAADVDVVAVVSAPAKVQRQRVLARPDMTAEKFAAILALQMPDAEKRKRANFIINTGLGHRFMRLQLRLMLWRLRGRRGHKFNPQSSVKLPKP